MHLDAERAADVLADHPHRRFRQLELARVQVLHHVRRLERVVHGQPLFGRAPVGELAARLERDTGVAPELEGGLDHGIGLGEGRVDAAGVEAAREAEVVTQLGVDDGRASVQSSFHVDYGLQPLDLHVHQLQGVLGLLARLRHHGHHRLTLPAGPFDRQRILRRRLHAGQVRQGGDPRLAHGRDVAPVRDHHHAGHAARGVGIDADDAAVRQRTAPEHDVRHARQLEVVDVHPLPLHQAARTGTLAAGADVARVFRDGRQQCFDLVRRFDHFSACRWREDVRVHAAVPGRLRRVSSVSQIASMIAW